MAKIKNNSEREKWSSDFGFLMASAGSAVGLGNLWKFPYLAGSSGGAIFLIFYFVLLVILGIPILLVEMSIGRKTRLNAIGACEKIRKGWGFVGAIGIFGAFVILSYYNVIGGWIIKYLFTYIFQGHIINPDTCFAEFSSSAFEPIIWLTVFLTFSALIVINGVSGGIEKISKIFLPLLLVFIIVLAVVSLALPGSSAGVRFFLVPDFSTINGFSDIAKIFLNAMGQVFFSLSLGMGTLITYGSYLDKNADIQKNSVAIPLIDTFIAIMAGFAILPAVFSFGMKPDAGAGLLFQTLPNVFERMTAGRFLAIIFFLLVFFAGITSSVSLLEVITSYFIDNHNWERKKAVIIVSVAVGIMGIFASLSFGAVKINLFGMSFFDFLTFLSDKILMPIGGFLLCILVGWLWGTKNIADEISSDGKYKFRYEKLLSFSLRYLTPVMILIILISSF